MLLGLPPFSTTGLRTKSVLLSGVALGATPTCQMHKLGQWGRDWLLLVLKDWERQEGQAAPTQSCCQNAEASPHCWWAGGPCVTYLTPVERTCPGYILPDCCLLCGPSASLSLLERGREGYSPPARHGPGAVLVSAPYRWLR